ncbi:hypothetical protein [Falsiroseomonas sp. CW058]|uniref:hypothetical protein n=1 Tax=Falsiroseomonas sp. CW058 TaxID=3388664 RepID=UPI003D3127DD
MQTNHFSSMTIGTRPRAIIQESKGLAAQVMTFSGDVTACLALPKVELGAFPTMPILPVAGKPAAATRALDGGAIIVPVSSPAAPHVERQTAATAATGFVQHVSLGRRDG